MWVETIRHTWRQANKRPVRTGLILLQVALGVWAVTTILGALFLLQGRLDDRQYIDVLFCRVIEPLYDASGQRAGYRTLPVFDGSEVDALLGGSDHLSSVAIANYALYDVAKVAENWWQVNGVEMVSAGYGEIAGLDMLQGSFFTTEDVVQGNRVVLISDQAAAILFPDGEALGREITFYHSQNRDFGDTFTVVGIFRTPDAMKRISYNQVHYLIPYISYRTAVADQGKGSGSSAGEGAGMGATSGVGAGVGTTFITLSYRLYAKAKPGKTAEAMADMDLILRQLHGEDVPIEIIRGTGGPADDIAGEMTGPLLILGALALTALVVGSIGIFTTMLISVVERTREMALRRALGATRGAVVRQVVMEAMLLSLAGGLVGVVAAAFTGTGIMQALSSNWGAAGSFTGGLPPPAALSALALAILVGGLFGLYPAWQAAAIPPAEGIREGII